MKNTNKSYDSQILMIGLVLILTGSTVIMFNYFAYGWIAIIILIFGGSWITGYLRTVHYRNVSKNSKN